LWYAMNAPIRSSGTGSASWLPMISSMYFTVRLLVCQLGCHHRIAAAQG
jgi:hypothetical protein